jgi:DUF4097 and DUF4098 domain-containing protein YvlB
MSCVVLLALMGLTSFQPAVGRHDAVPPAHGGPDGDTLVAVRPGEALAVQNFSGRLVVGAWERDEVELRGAHGDRSDLRLERVGSRLSVEPSRRRPGDREMDVELRIPAWMDVRVGGRDLDVEIHDVDGQVQVRNVEGDVVISGTGGAVRVTTVDGSVRVRGARGDLFVRSEGDDIRLDDVVAAVVEVGSGSGDLTLRNVDAHRMEAETLDGDVLFDGIIRTGGSYSISVHDGDAEVVIPRDAGAEVSVSTFDGEFMSDFPVTVERFNAGRTFDFTLGDGSARLDIQVFDGEIRLRERR